MSGELMVASLATMNAVVKVRRTAQSLDREKGDETVLELVQQKAQQKSQPMEKSWETMMAAYLESLKDY